MKLRKNVLVTPVALATIALVGCGGGDNNNNNATAPKVEAGQPYTVSMLVNDKEINSSTYMVYSVSDDQGTLSDKALAQAEEQKLPHVVVLQSSTDNAPQAAIARYTDSAAASVPKLAAAIPLTDVFACYKDLFSTVKAIHPEFKTRDQIAKRLADFGVTVDEICNQIPSSGLTMTEYVNLFDKITRYWPNVTNIDGEAARFFRNIGVRPITFQNALTENGYTWDGFLSRISGRPGNGLDEFYKLYEESDLAIKPFLAYYMETATQPKLVVQTRKHLKLLAAMADNALISSAYAQQASPTGAFLDTLNKTFTIPYFELAKAAWDVVKNSQGILKVDKTVKQSSIVSSSDKDTLNYYGSKDSKSDTVSFVGKANVGWWENYRVDMNLICEYDAKHATLPGQWLPNINFITPVVYTSWGMYKGYEVTGKVVANNATNKGTPENPIPSIDLTMQMSATSFSTVNKDFTFNCNGASGATFKY